MLYAAQLDKLIPQVSKPDWLLLILANFQGKKFERNNTLIAAEFSKFLLTRIREIEAPILTPDEVNYDFDQAFVEAREQQEIPATFDRLIEKLEQIIAADLIDSRVVQQTLERLMAMLKRNRQGSLASILVSMHYGRFVQKAFTGVLTANKYLKPMLEAFNEEFAIAEQKVRSAEATLKKEAVRRLTNEERLKAFLTQNAAEDSDSIIGLLESNHEGEGHSTPNHN